MIENKKFKYSTGNEFSFKGENYIGYYNVNNGVAYKTRDRQDDILESKNNISSLIELGGEYFDRNIQDTLVFKNKLEDILFAPNEIINTIKYEKNLLLWFFLITSGLLLVFLMFDNSDSVFLFSSTRCFINSSLDLSTFNLSLSSFSLITISSLICRGSVIGSSFL